MRPNLTELLYFEGEAGDIVVESQSQISSISIKSLSIQFQRLNNQLNKPDRLCQSQPPAYQI